MTPSNDTPQSPKTNPLSAKVAALLVYGRPGLVFGGMICALAVMWKQDPLVYTLGVCFLLLSMSFDLESSRKQTPRV